MISNARGKGDAVVTRGFEFALSLHGDVGKDESDGFVAVRAPLGDGVGDRGSLAAHQEGQLLQQVVAGYHAFRVGHHQFCGYEIVCVGGGEKGRGEVGW